MEVKLFTYSSTACNTTSEFDLLVAAVLITISPLQLQKLLSYNPGHNILRLFGV